MARATSNKLYRTFVKGLVTEASPLTYPEDTSYDELNTVLSRKGSRTRRLGIDHDVANLIASLEESAANLAASSKYEFVWKSVEEDANTNFLVVQRGLTVNFIDLNDNTLKGFSIDLSDYVISDFTTTEAKNVFYQMASGKGFLFIVGRAISPLAVEYSSDDDDITVTAISVLIRDFDGLDDDLANDEEPTTLSKEHHYNLMNQGWVYGSQSSSTFSPTSYSGYTIEDVQSHWRRDYTLGTSYSTSTPTDSPIQKYFNSVGRYPGNNKQWWVAKAEADDTTTGVHAGDFLPDVLNKIFSGNARAPRGHFILNAFSKNRQAVSGISNLTTESLPYRPEGIAFFSGRAWYGAGSHVYYSQIIDTTGIHKAGLCYQEADPTAEDISDLIDTDGGVIYIPEAVRVRVLIPLADGVVVLAENGVWFIGGIDSAFAATSVSLTKISTIGTRSPYAALVVDTTLFWWSEVGIQALEQASGQFGPIPNKFGNSSISEQTVQTLFNEIDETNKTYVKGTYDPRSNTVYWLYDEEYDLPFQYDKCLIFDLTLQAFFKWGFATITNGPVITGIYPNLGVSFSTSGDLVVDGSGNQVIDASANTVISSSISSIYSPTSMVFIANMPTDGMALCTVSNTNYMDWETYNAVGETYLSFVETGYELFEDAMRDKQAIYVFCHFKRADNSSCRFRTKWDWASGSASNRWSSEIEAYRERIRPASPTTADNEAFEVVTTKNMVRGHGKAIQFYFGCEEEGKNFELLGWSIAASGSSQP